MTRHIAAYAYIWRHHRAEFLIVPAIPAFTFLLAMAGIAGGYNG